MRKWCLTFVWCISFLAGKAQERNEVIYHIFNRSFFDSNGDSVGDFDGIRDKLGYLQHLGVTSILLTPIYTSAFYHNYFADDFFRPDPKYGTKADFVNLVEAVHARGMKIYLDMEAQYVTDKNPWWGTDLMMYADSQHTRPAPIIWGLTQLTGYNDSTRKVALVDLRSPAVLDSGYRLFASFADPNGDGKFNDGVDGFRLDHTMDDLDGSPRETGLFTNYWAPLLQRLRRLNPKLTFVAEQANWGSFGLDYFSQATVDRVFDFRLCFAISSFKKEAIEAAADTSLGMLPTGKEQVVFIENHDMDRFASRVDGEPGRERVGADLNLLLGGIPSIYYGQELGMTGIALKGNTDGNDIPRREAFEWYASDAGKGMALWYKGYGTDLKPNDGISLEEEEDDPGSLWTYYHDLLRLRAKYPALWAGNYQTLDNDNDEVLSFLRSTEKQKVVVVVNLSARSQHAGVDITAQGGKVLTGEVKPSFQGSTMAVDLPPYGLTVVELE